MNNRFSDVIVFIVNLVELVIYVILYFSFLDKMYFLSSGPAMSKFLKNPRTYIMPPQPRPPCKLCVTGPPRSGKTTVAHLLAQKYNAKVSS